MNKELEDEAFKLKLSHRTVPLFHRAAVFLSKKH